MTEQQTTQSVALPWHTDQWQRLVKLTEASRLPHALLLTGSPGIGKVQFAQAFASYLLCASPDKGLPCGQCRPCQLLQAGTHPDYRLLEPEEAGKRIKVDQVRWLADFLYQTAQFGEHKIAVLSPAEAMNENAANALLKSLEEPGNNTVLLLVADAPGRLLPTIRSRCQSVLLAKPQPEQAREWLQRVVSDSGLAEQLLLESQYQPLTAIKLFERNGLEQASRLDKGFFDMLNGRQPAVALVDQWQEYELPEILLWLLQRVQGLIRHLQAGQPLSGPWGRLADTDCRDLFGFSDSLSILLVKVDQGAVPNRQLILESLLLESCDVFHNQGLSQ